MQAPSFTTNPHNNDTYSAYNKPEAVIDWLSKTKIEVWLFVPGRRQRCALGLPPCTNPLVARVLAVALAVATPLAGSAAPG